jgi:hypothetical protein
MLGSKNPRKIIGWMLLGIYALIFVGGDALHALPGCQHHHHTSSSAHADGHHGHANQGCHHDHGHSHQDEKDAGAQVVASDMDCSICELLSQRVLEVKLLSFDDSSTEVEALYAHEIDVPLRRVVDAYSIRGPPAIAMFS